MIEKPCSANLAKAAPISRDKDDVQSAITTRVPMWNGEFDRNQLRQRAMTLGFYLLVEAIVFIANGRKRTKY
jgi:hypothetical protein